MEACASSSSVTVKIENEYCEELDGSDHWSGLVEFVECKEGDPSELKDYGVNTSDTENNSLADCDNQDTSSSFGGNKVKCEKPRSSHNFEEIGLSDSDDLDEDAPTGKRKRFPSESGSSDEDETSSGEEDATTDPSWSKIPGSMRNFKFNCKNKLLVPVPGANQPIDWFNLLFDDVLLNRIVEATNKNAEKIISDPHTPSNSRIFSWTPMSLSELKTFIGLLYHMGTIKMIRLQNYWKTDGMFGLGYVRSRMPRVRFFHIMKCFSIIPPDEGGENKQIERLIEWFNETMERVYYPGKDLVLDEGVMLCKGRKQFSNEYAKGGFKLYTLSEPAGPVLAFSVTYKGDGKQSGLTRVAKEFMSRKCSGHSITIYNDRLGFTVAKELLDIKTHCNCLLQPDSKDIPAEVKSAKLAKRQSVARYAEGVMIGRWKSRGPDMYYLSTELCTNAAPDLKSTVIAKHAETTDLLVEFYPVFEQTFLPWSKKFFIDLLQVIMFNTFKLFFFGNLKDREAEARYENRKFI